MSRSQIQKPTLSALVRAHRSVESRSGFTVNVQDDVWQLLGGSINFFLIKKTVSPGLLNELKQCFADVCESGLADNTIKGFSFALNDLLRFSHQKTGSQIEDLTDTIISSWHQSATSPDYPGSLKAFISKSRQASKSRFPQVSVGLLSKLKKKSQDAEFVLSLHPHKGPWLEAEVIIQDTAIERAYINGDWSSEVYLLVQLLRFYGMRVGSLSRMKISDVHVPSITDHERPQVRWPFLKNDKSPEEALFWPLGGTLLSAMEDYLKQRLSGIPKRSWQTLPLFTPEGLPGSFVSNFKATGSKEVGYEGHVSDATLGARFRYAMQSLNLTTTRSGHEEAMKFSPHRERHTVGTRLALKGYSAEQIALFLGQVSAESATPYVELAVLCMQLRNPAFYNMMDEVGALYLNPTVTRSQIEAELEPVISMEASTADSLALIGGGNCGECMFAGSSTAAEPWPCLSCPKFHVFEDADLQPLWDILQERQVFMSDENGHWNDRFDPDIKAQFQRYETLLISIEMHRQKELEVRRELEKAYQ